MARTAIDIVLEGVSNGSITNDDAKILLEAINKPPQTVTVGYIQSEGTTDNQLKTTLTTNG